MKRQKIVITVEARMSSSRLPGKMIKPILGRPVLELLIERLKRVKLADEIIIATSIKKENEIIEEISRRLQVRCFRGSEEDVLKRVLQAAKSIQADIIVEITGDCPLTDPEIVDQCLNFFLKNNFNYVSNGGPVKTFPAGLAVQVFPVKVLEEVDRLTNDPQDREHVSLYIYRHPQKYRLGYLRAKGQLIWPELFLCLDTEKDFQLIKAIFEHLYPQGPNFSAVEVIKYLRQHPHLTKINHDRARVEEYLKR